jgi:mono/diheme cytochrome c family protein
MAPHRNRQPDMTSKTNTPSKLRLRAVAFVLAAAVSTWASAIQAQDDAAVKAGLAAWKKGGCADCHGPFADGDKENNEAPTGANLRATRLDDASLKQTIGCGRLGTPMPYFDEGAYEKRPCYGLADPPDEMTPGANTLAPREIDDLVTYLKARVMGRGPITRAECEFYYEGASGYGCESYK